ncbi:hypothetical protein M472_01240 [Sphingobacterium paucimobilis HER1398]|uniref:Uncharacterized protein n=1 Tax=Sphingobacterium paucimobilis HER1398 TaxID=1346330 RepID=U2H6P4_9SPHI|nr:hypothetical protein M472_01240 [Sphingobacterium paucimobilis HER1398]
MNFSENFIQVLILTAIVIIGISVMILIVLFIRDVINKQVW